MSERYEINTRGLVISRAGFGEGSVRISLYTEERGLVSAFAKSAREERSKLRPHLQVGTYGVFDLVRGNVGWRVVGATNTRNMFLTTREMPRARIAVGRMISVLRLLVQGEEQNDLLLKEIVMFLDALPFLSVSDIPHAERLVVVKMLHALGYVSLPAQFFQLTPAYTKETCAALIPLEREMIHAIREGFSVSGLVGTLRRDPV